MMLIAIIGLIISISAVIAGVYPLMERLFANRRFTIFRVLTSKLLQSSYPHDATITWFSISSGRSLYDIWYMAPLYLLLLFTLFVIAVGCWVFLALRLAEIYDIGTLWLGFWFTLNLLIYFCSAVNQYAVEIKITDREATMEKINNYMKEHPGLTLKRWTYYFLKNWLVTPLGESVLLLIISLFVLLHWPAWLLNALCPKHHVSLTNRRTRKYYYQVYALLAGIVGLVLLFLAK